MLISICPKCSKPNDDCACEVFQGLEEAYDQDALFRGCMDCDILDLDNKYDPKNKDLGSHYRHSFMGHKIDVYRVLEIFNVTDPVAQHIVKKLLRGEKKGHTMEFVWNEVEQAVERKFEMMEEDNA